MIKDRMGRGYRVCRVCASVFSDHTIEHAAVCELSHFGIDVRPMEKNIRRLEQRVSSAHSATDEAVDEIRKLKAENARLKTDNIAYEAQRISAIWGDEVKLCRVCEKLFEPKIAKSNIVCQNCQDNGWEGK